MGIHELQQTIREQKRLIDHGADIITKVAEWLVKNSSELPHVQGKCYDLFRAHSDTFSCDEYSLAALAFMDIPMFLMTYFDPQWRVLHQLKGWYPRKMLGRVYISYPFR